MLSETTANYILGCSEFKKYVSHYKPKYCKFGNFREGFIREDKTLAK